MVSRIFVPLAMKRNEYECNITSESSTISITIINIKTQNKTLSPILASFVVLERYSPSDIDKTAENVISPH